ncbi:hypothetical protein Q4489_03060 [Thalassotalea sp. 1_MG-2023]|uniref:hypothetical protein n=1 Tax=Thalassotalea sp. 1_MG-2023 TaxID=3062680 RepID=UPI0026E282FD|nr:hypothetical protein [Thalassotalea sp. 1_MG-2023]MDO6425972.1 hypothetical protein [Thalassotalea sp. 1_MG-2023]
MMMFLLAVLAIFIAVSVYFYFKAESLQQQLIAAKREMNNAKKEAKVLIESVAVIARKNEEVVKNRARNLQERDTQIDAEFLDLLHPFINNYAVIYTEALREKGKLHKITKKCFESYQKNSYRKFTGQIGVMKPHINRAWSENNIAALITFTEAIFYYLENPESEE